MRTLLLGWTAFGILFFEPRQIFAQSEKQSETHRKTVEKWIKILKGQPDQHDRKQARQVLGPKGSYSKLAIPALIDALEKSSDNEIDSGIPDILADYGADVVPSLLMALKRPEVGIREGALTALAEIRPTSKALLPALLNAMHDSSPKVRAEAATNLPRLARSTPEAIGALIATLADKDDTVRAAAANALSQLGRKSGPAVPSLILGLDDKNPTVQENAARALGSIGLDAKAAVPTLIKALQTKNRDKNGCLLALRGIGPGAVEAVPVLIEILKNDEKMGEEAASALGAIGPGAKSAVPTLMVAAQHEKENEMDDGKCDRAIIALGKIGPDARAAVPLLIKILSARQSNRTSLYSVAIVASALGDIGPDAGAAISPLTAIARKRIPGEDMVRVAAAEAVLKIDPVFGAKEGMKDLLHPVKLGRIPSIQLPPRKSLDKATESRIKALIAKLADIQDPDFGISATLTGRAFAPLPDRTQMEMGLLTDHEINSSNALRELVAMGPVAIPFLLESLNNDTPTKLRIDNEFGAGSVCFEGELEVNPVNPTENGKSETASFGLDHLLEPARGAYAVKVGDVCFVILGQIVGRPYAAVRYQPTAMIVINSPVENDALLARLRAIWSNKDAAKMLFDSLLVDYATEGSFNGQSLDGWRQGSELQIEAALRLLYYFPEESIPLIVSRLNKLDVRKPGPDDDASMKRDVHNGVDAKEFIEAVRWSKDSRIKEALANLFRRTDDFYLMMAVAPSLDASQAASLSNRLQAMIEKLPASEDRPRGEGFHLLVAIIQRQGKKAWPVLQRYLQKANLQRSWTICDVLMETKASWAKDLLIPMLTDHTVGQFPVGTFTYATETGKTPQRLCDRAAWTLSELDPDLKFELKGPRKDLDRQIAVIREKVAGRRK
jgi:HEAT repeat protein